MKAYIYWIHLPEHTAFSEGYIGVARNPKRRFNTHKKSTMNTHLRSAFQKYGDKITQHIIWVGDEENCYIIEAELRPQQNTGWNQAEGGNRPPNHKGRTHNEEWERNRVESRRRNNGGKYWDPPINGMLGKRHREESKQKARLSMIGKNVGKKYPNRKRPGEVR